MNFKCPRCHRIHHVADYDAQDFICVADTYVQENKAPVQDQASIFVQICNDDGTPRKDWMWNSKSTRIDRHEDSVITKIQNDGDMTGRFNRSNKRAKNW